MCYLLTVYVYADTGWYGYRWSGTYWFINYSGSMVDTISFSFTEDNIFRLQEDCHLMDLIPRRLDLRYRHFVLCVTEYLGTRSIVIIWIQHCHMNTTLDICNICGIHSWKCWKYSGNNTFLEISINTWTT